MLFGSAQVDFQAAYTQNNLVPSGVLEAVAWTNTHMVHLDNQAQACSGIPQPYGIMGLHEDGANYFNKTGELIENLSGITILAQKQDPQSQIMAYAISFHQLMNNELTSGESPSNPALIRNVLYHLSEIPDSGIVNQLARDMQVYSILKFMNSPENGQQYGFNSTNYNLSSVFGASNYAVLSSPKISIGETQISSENNAVYTLSAEKSAQYGPAIWNPAPACNFSSRNGVAISAITIHTIQGSYAGAISWSQNCTSNVSFHYVIRSSDGQVTQMVLEEDKGWHVGSENPYTIGYEHEGFVNDPSWYTPEMYQSSADLSRDITNSGYGISPLRTYFGPASVTTDVLGACTKIKGHQHYPNQTHVDPGINWDWEKYYRLINNAPTINTITSNSGSFYDTGGAGGNYQDDERELWLFQPLNSSNVTLDFTLFNTELDYDYLYLYDGDSIGSPLIGVYSGTNSPGIITSSGPSLLVEFRSDCGTNAPGWEVTYTSTLVDITNPSTSIIAGNTWQTNDFLVDFTDIDLESGVQHSFYLVAERNNGSTTWSSNLASDFVNEDFEENSINWTDVTGTYSLSNGAYSFGDITEQNSNSYALINQANSSIYLYEWDQTITSTDINQRAGLHFFCDDATLSNRGNSYFVYLRENDDKVQIYSVDNNLYTLEMESSLTILTGTTYNCKVIYNPNSGKIMCYIDDEFIVEWTDSTPLTNGNSISLRSGGCSADFDDVHVYTSRTFQENILALSANWMSIESENAVPSGMIRTVIVDSMNNWSAEATFDYLIDYTAPFFSFVNDGISNDIDTFYTTTINSNWSSSDIHSGVSLNEYAVGTAIGLDDVIGWTNNTLMESFSQILAAPIYDQIYYTSVRSTNNAGLIETTSTNGQRYLEGLGVDSFSDLNGVLLYPNPASGIVKIDGITTSVDILVYDTSGKMCLNKTATKQFDVSQLAEGSYSVVINLDNSFVVKRLVVKEH